MECDLGRWVTMLIRLIYRSLADAGRGFTHLIPDRDSKFTTASTRDHCVVAREIIEMIATGTENPDARADVAQRARL